MIFMISNHLKVAYEIATTELEETLSVIDWPPASPEEVMNRFKERMHDRLYGDRDLLKEEED
jgi:hypothetical protein